MVGLPLEQVSTGSEVKKPWESKTIWVSALAALVPFFPPAAVWIAANPEIYSIAMGGIFSLLRVVTKGKVSIS